MNFYCFFICYLVVIFRFRQIIAEEDDLEASKRYTIETFPDEIVKNNHFVMFYAPWCTHCKRLHPTWEELARLYNREGSEVTIAKVDCTTDTALCSEQDVTGYPTLKFFLMNQKEGVRFRQTRDVASFISFINQQLGLDETEKDVGGDNRKKVLMEMNDDNYRKILSSGNHFVKFYAPWCGHCQRLAPTWDLLAIGFGLDLGITIGKIDCTVNKEACKTYDIKSYPTLLWIQDGVKVDKYQGGRTLEELTSWVEEMKGGAGRTSEGGTNASHGGEGFSPVVELTSRTFDDAIGNGITFVKFFAPWCGHCKRLAHTWEELGKKFLSTPTISIAKVDCTIQDNKELCNNQEVDGFPTLVLYRKGQKVAEYTGSRGLEELYDFVDKNSSHDEL